jgi:hypothetical protein
MCNCRTDIEQKLHAHILTQIPEGSKDLCVRLNGYALLMGEGTLDMKNVMPIDIEYAAPIKRKPGEFKVKHTTQNMTGNYCMFCGEKYEKDAEPYADPRNGAETWSANGEDWHNISSLDDLIRESADDLTPLKAGYTVCVGSIHYQDPAGFTDPNAVLDGMQEVARQSDAGEWVDDYPNPGDVAHAELSDLLESWARKHCRPDFYLVKEVREYTITAEDMARAMARKEPAEAVQG